MLRSLDRLGMTAIQNQKAFCERHAPNRICARPPPRSLLPPGRPSGILWPMKRHLPVIGLLVLAALALLVAGCGPI